jgi:hypothetical protein
MVIVGRDGVVVQLSAFWRRDTVTGSWKKLRIGIAFLPERFILVESVRELVTFKTW